MLAIRFQVELDSCEAYPKPVLSDFSAVATGLPNSRTVLLMTLRLFDVVAAVAIKSRVDNAGVITALSRNKPNIF